MNRTVPTSVHDRIDEILPENSGVQLTGHRELTTSKPRHFTFEQLGPEPKVGNILVATDFSPASAKAIQRAVEIASQYHATLTILHVIDILRPCHTGSAEDMMRALREESSYRMSQLSRDLARGPEVHFSLKEGFPWEEIVLKSRHFDLLILAHEEDHKRSKWFSQQTWQRVIDSAACPVLTVSWPGEHESLSRVEAVTARHTARTTVRGAVRESQSDGKVRGPKVVSSLGPSHEQNSAMSQPQR